MLEIDKDGGRFWFNEEGEFHREDGPAIEWKSGGKEWYLNDKLHRIDGPASEWSSGARHWYLNGKEYSEEEYKKGGEGIC